MVKIYNHSMDPYALSAERAIRDALAHMPSEFLGGLSYVEIADAPTGRSSRRAKGHRLAEYDPKLKTITIYLAPLLAEFPRPFRRFQVTDALFHELGHHCDLWVSRTHERSNRSVESAADRWKQFLWDAYLTRKHPHLMRIARLKPSRRILQSLQRLAGRVVNIGTKTTNKGTSD